MVQMVMYGIVMEYQLFVEDFQQVFYCWVVVKVDYIEVDVVVFFQIGGGEQVVYYLFYIYLVGVWDNYQMGWVFVV